MTRATDIMNRRGTSAQFSFVLLLVFSCLAIFSQPSRADAPVSKEYEVKAACLFNFAKFVEWPSSTFASDDAPLTIGVLGDDPFGDLLDQIVAGETVGKHPLKVQRSKQLEELKSCQILFVCNSERDRIPEIVQSLDKAHILSVGETEGFARRGGVVNFYLDGNKVRFEINSEAAKRNGLNISSDLLRLAKIVNP